jgi:asparagine synthase (glutamine-hydrolysing)
MAHALEVRVPLLDHELMEFAARIPAHYKVQSRDGKYIFKKPLRDILPNETLNRRKMGFSVALGQWLRGDLKGLFEGLVL